MQAAAFFYPLGVEKLTRTELTDGTLLLRPWRLEDVPRVTEACQDPEIPRWTAVIPEPYIEADARTWIEQTIREWDEGMEAAFAVADVQTGEVLGAIGLNLQQHFALQASIGYWVAKEARGRGVATAALRLVSGWALQDLGLPRLQLLTDPENAASMRVAEKAGFQQEGLLRRYIQARGRGRRDCLMFSLLPGELDGGDRG